MRPRYLAIAAAIWTVGFGAFYTVVIHSQGDAPAWWLLAALGVASVLLVLPVSGVLPASGRRRRPLLISGTVILGLCALLGILSIGILLIPAVCLATVAAARA